MGYNKQIRPVDWHEYDALCILPLNPQAQQYEGFTPRQRVSGARRKDRFGRSGVQVFCDFTNQTEAPETQTHLVILQMRWIQKASIESDFQGNSIYREIDGLKT